MARVSEAEVEAFEDQSSPLSVQSEEDDVNPECRAEEYRVADEWLQWEDGAARRAEEAFSAWVADSIWRAEEELKAEACGPSHSVSIEIKPRVLVAPARPSGSDVEPREASGAIVARAPSEATAQANPKGRSRRSRTNSMEADPDVPPEIARFRAEAAEKAMSVTDQKIRSSPLCLAGWFGYGKPGLATPTEDWPKLKPSSTNWFHGRLASDPKAYNSVTADAAEIQVAAYAWTLLNQLRFQKGLPIILPGNNLMGRRGKPGVLGDLFKVRGAKPTEKLIDTIVVNYENIMERLSWMEDEPPLDEVFIRHRAVVREADKIIAASG